MLANLDCAYVLRGTPGSGTTSLSALSTTAIKDGHQGHAPPHGHHHGHQHSTSSSSSTNTLDAERADRISRLAGLERLATVRGVPGPGHLAPGSTANQPPGYFDGANPQARERSTVGSASATGSVGGRTTWASSSDVNETDKMSEDQDDGTSSMGGLSDEGNASLVGFGEGATSVADGPTSTIGRGTGRPSGVASPPVGRANMIASYIHQQGHTPPASAKQHQDAKARDQLVSDNTAMDVEDRETQYTQMRDANATGVETAERIVRERLDEDERARQAQIQRDDPPSMDEK